MVFIQNCPCVLRHEKNANRERDQIKPIKQAVFIMSKENIHGYNCGRDDGDGCGGP